jgi:hypothetical protein
MPRPATCRLHTHHELVHHLAFHASGKPTFFLQKKRFDGLRILFGQLPECPRHGLDNHVLRIAAQHAADAQCVPGISSAAPRSFSRPKAPSCAARISHATTRSAQPAPSRSELTSRSTILGDSSARTFEYRRRSERTDRVSIRGRAATSRRTPSCTLRQDFISNASATRHHWLRRRAISRPRPSVWRAHCCQPVRYSSVAWRALDTATNQSVHSLVVLWGTATSSSPWFKESSPFSSRLAKKDYRDRIGVRDVCTMELITILNRRE